ncbi:hypothetical protein [Bacillus pseudomycoides]|nr:hypothetical protein [Bacillus pseudomycoides]
MLQLIIMLTVGVFFLIVDRPLLSILSLFIIFVLKSLYDSNSK